MIKLSILMVRRSDLTYEQFIQHWGEVHGPLVAAQSESKQYVRRYIQDHRTSDALPGTTASNFDGIAEIWFDDISGAKAFFESVMLMIVGGLIFVPIYAAHAQRVCMCIHYDDQGRCTLVHCTR
jgi:uncharacterized protein (TIGR02118 family)